ncbi:hypothetical protein [Leptospira sarikeiensis]|uniref:hypothetical protein n=1 Tax=Leptospira sarikeiensis TaxID=2484943 RepID=UPI001FE4CDD8|nr:hypothetical protein [Leptospira sarikeiensis]
MDPNLGWDPKGKRVFLLDIRSNTVYRPVDLLGEIGIRLGDCEGMDKIEYPYTYYFFPSEKGGNSQISKYEFENSKLDAKSRKKMLNSYEEETKRVLVAFKNSCFKDGINQMEVQMLGYELLSFKFFFEY